MQGLGLRRLGLGCEFDGLGVGIKDLDSARCHFFWKCRGVRRAVDCLLGGEWV